MIKALKNYLKKQIVSVLNQQADYKKISAIEKKIDRLSILLNDLYPDKIYLSGQIIDKINEFCLLNKITDLNVSISKNDLMFHYGLHNFRSASEAILYYFNRGFKLTCVIDNIIKKQSDNFKPIEILDFASGHGTLTRFLIQKYPSNIITVSDIKKKAVDFQIKTFHVNGIVSSTDPNEFKPSKKYSIIIVSSLFSHLPEKKFIAWLNILYSLLDDKGLLLISTNNIKYWRPELNSKDFLFENISEDLIFNEFDDSISDTNEYGLTYISDNYMTNLLTNLGIDNKNYLKHDLAWEKQDLFVISKNLVLGKKH